MHGGEILADLHRYHFSVEYFEDLRNVNHCEFVVMKKNLDSGKYILENQLRTWSELKRQRDLLSSKAREEQHVPVRKKWGGCPDGCNHGRARTQSRGGAHEQHHRDHRPAQLTSSASPGSGGWNGGSSTELTPGANTSLTESNLRSTFPQNPTAMHHHDGNHAREHGHSRSLSHPQGQVLSPSRTSSLPLSVLQVGRDFGGSNSGAASRASSLVRSSRSSSASSPTPSNSDADSSSADDEESNAKELVTVPRKPMKKRRNRDGHHLVRRAKENLRSRSGSGSGDGMRHGTRANALGDHSEDTTDREEARGTTEADILKEDEREDRSLRGSVY